MKSKTSLAVTPWLQKALLGCAAAAEHPLTQTSAALKKLADDVKKISCTYSSRHPGEARTIYQNPDLSSAYLTYYLPVNLVKLHPILDELVQRAHTSFLESDNCSVLDLGCGPGTFTLGFIEYLVKNRPLLPIKTKKVSLWAVDRQQENLRTAAEIINAYLNICPIARDFTWELICKKASISRKPTPDVIPHHTTFNLIIAGNIVTELDDALLPVVARRAAQLLAPGGALILIDPGTRHASRRLLALRNMLAQDTSLVLAAPCLSPGVCPLTETSGQWCHEKIFWEPPPVVATIDRYTGFTKRKGIKYSYFAFIKHPARPEAAFPAVSRTGLWRVISYIMKYKGAQQLMVCNGRTRIMLRRLSRNASTINKDFASARRGDLARIENCVHHEAFWDITQNSRFVIAD